MKSNEFELLISIRNYILYYSIVISIFIHFYLTLSLPQFLLCCGIGRIVFGFPSQQQLLYDYLRMFRVSPCLALSLSLSLSRTEHAVIYMEEHNKIITYFCV